MKNFRTIWLAIIAFMMITVTSCSNHEDYFGLDVENKSNVKRTTRTSCIDCSEYLTISTYDFNQWSDKDYDAFNTAMDRIGVEFSESKFRYVFEEPSGKEINISDSLYNCVVQMFEGTNLMLDSLCNQNEGIGTRMKTRAAESSSSNSTKLPDCVPVAISNMGINAPSLEDALKKCDELFPDWREKKGVPIESVKSFIEVYTPVMEYTNLEFCTTEGMESLNNCVVQILNGIHTLNAVSVYNGKTIFLEDFSSSPFPQKTMTEVILHKIFPFD